MSKSGAAHWVKFFNAAGIPSPAAATYAHLFVENRIQGDMLMELNKEYLREMGVTPMGDIIAILRHAKSVNDQHARDRVLTTECIPAIPIAAVAASPVPHSSGKISLKSANACSNSKQSKHSSSELHLLPKLPRRVLPEHEGKYKIKFPEGTTERSKQILAKRDKLYSDRVSSTKKSDVLTRLSGRKRSAEDSSFSSDDMEDDSDMPIVSSSAGNNDSNVRVKITGLGNNNIKRSISSGLTGSSSASVFARLGGKTEVSVTKQIKPILKNSQRVSSGGVTKPKAVVAMAAPIVRQQQKVIMVRKVPIKRGDSDDDDYCADDGYIQRASMPDDDSRMDFSTANEKIVKFASIAEVREIAPISNYKNAKQFGGGGGGNIKSRLGIVSKLHATKKTYNLKATPTKSGISPVKGKVIRMKSDELLTRQDLPVHQRLGNSNVKIKPRTPTSNNNLNSKFHRHVSAASSADAARRKNTSSVFDRLGFNNSI